MAGQPEPESMAAKAMNVMLFLSIIFGCVSATNHTVGGPSGWDLASDVKNWASKTPFTTGDNLVFVYKQDHNVIEVGEQGYAQCQIGNPIHKYVGGDTVIPLTNPGTRYFVCGKPISRCFQGLKVQINVLRNKTVSDATAPIGSDDQVKSPDATTELCHRHGPPQSPRRYSPHPPSHGFLPPRQPSSHESPPSDFPPIEFPPRPSDNANGDLAAKDGDGFLVHYWYALVVIGVLGLAVSGFCFYHWRCMCICESCGGCIAFQNQS